MSQTSARDHPLYRTKIQPTLDVDEENMSLPLLDAAAEISVLYETIFFSRIRNNFSFHDCMQHQSDLFLWFIPTVIHHNERFLYITEMAL